MHDKLTFMITAHGYGFSALARRDHAVVRPVAVPDVISGDGYITYMSTGYQAAYVHRCSMAGVPFMSAV